jgi:hypothetical protein
MSQAERAAQTGVEARAATAKGRIDGLTMLILGSVMFLAFGGLMARTNPLGMTDFLQIYASSRCVEHHHDPYKPGELLTFYQADTGGIPSDSSVVSSTYRKIVLIAPNLPTTLFLVAPIAALPWKLAVPLWALLIAASFILAASLVWRFGVTSSPRLHGALLLLILVNSGLLLSTGNTAGLVVSLSVIAVCCFLRDRWGAAGVLCLALALVMKPHDAGPIWFYFFLAGGRLRRRALQTLALTALITVPALFWVAHAAPHWLPELRSNLALGLAPGGLNNPGPTTEGGRGIGQIISLQAVLSLVWDNAGFYNLAAWLIAGPLIAAWCWKTLRSDFSPRLAWFALAAIAPLTMLPVYHRTYDARLLLLAVPACVLLWEERRARGRWALALTLAAIVLTGDLFWVVFFQITHYSSASVALGVIPAPLALLAMGAFYLYIYLGQPRRDSGIAEDKQSRAPDRVV